jgi:hypothetical protein
MVRPCVTGACAPPERDIAPATWCVGGPVWSGSGQDQLLHLPLEILLPVGCLDPPRTDLDWEALEHAGCAGAICRNERHNHGHGHSTIFSTWSYSTNPSLALEVLQAAAKRLLATSPLQRVSYLLSCKSSVKASRYRSRTIGASSSCALSRLQSARFRRQRGCETAFGSGARRNRFFSLNSGRKRGVRRFRADGTV